MSVPLDIRIRVVVDLEHVVVFDLLGEVAVKQPELFRQRAVSVAEKGCIRDSALNMRDVSVRIDHVDHHDVSVLCRLLVELLILVVAVIPGVGVATPLRLLCWWTRLDRDDTTVR